MVKISNDVPKFIIEMLGSVDFSRITDADYDKWIQIIRANLFKHLRVRKRLVPMLVLDFPIRQDLLDLINGYDFSSLDFKKQVMLVPLVKQWVACNLPLKRAIK